MADPLDELSSLLFSLLATTNFDKHARRFWPEGCLDSMMTKQGTQELISEALGIQLNDPIIKFIIGSAKKLLAIVVILEFRKPLTAMKLFKEKSFSDSDLPLMDSDFERLKDSSHGSTFWSDSRKSSFSDKQWEFVVPVIDLDNPSHKWSFSHILPFVKKEEAASGSFGKVSRCEIHKAHLTSAQNTSYRPTVVAIKRLEPEVQQHDKMPVMENWKKEAKVLKDMNDLSKENGHSVRFLTAFCLEAPDDETPNEYNLMFEWADGGNLKNLWDNEDLWPRLRLRRGLIQEAVTQLQGLSETLCRAHYPDDNTQRNYRHTDLKPTNILRFKDGCDVDNNDRVEAGIGRLKICDWGLATEQNEVTDLRPDGTNNHAGTRRYEPPEESAREDSLSVPGSSRRKRSRLYDIWAMGCITLEFIIWLMYGPKELKRFNGSFEGPFYEGGGSQRRVHRVVKQWIEHMKKDPNCEVTTTALGDLLDVVETRLLVVKIPPYGAREPANALTRVSSPADESNAGMAGSTSPTAEVPDIIVHGTTSAGPSKDERANARDYSRYMERIVEEHEAADTYWFRGETESGLPTPEANETNAVDGYSADSQTPGSNQSFHGQLAVRSSRALLTSSRRVS